MRKRKITMEKIRELLRLHYQQELSIRKACSLLGISKTSGADYIREFKKTGYSFQEIVQISDSSLMELIEQSNVSTNKRYEILSQYFEYYEKELKRPGVNLLVLWQEYKDKEPEGLSYSRFCHYYRSWKLKQPISMHIEHKAGDKMFVDFAGKKLQIVNRETGEIIPVEVFVAILGASQLTYVEASLTQQKEDWIRLNENALHYFEGVPRAIVPDNLKSGVTKACNYEPQLNASYYDFARHYNTVILPARPVKPKDKSLVENAVGIVYQRIYSRLRNITFFSIEELNESIWDELDKHNNQYFQKRKISRIQLFQEIEKSQLQPLPIHRYEMKYFMEVKVQFNYHVYLNQDKHYYSVPYRYVGKRVKIIYTDKIVEVYKNNQRIAFHRRDRQPYRYTTNSEHMPKSHQYVSQWSPERFINWASTIGVDIKEFIISLLESKSHPEQAFKACMGVMRLAKKYDNPTMNKVCRKALDINCISYQFIDNSIKNKTYKFKNDDSKVIQLPLHKNIRGKENYK